MAGISFFEVYGTANVMSAIFKFEDVNVKPHDPNLGGSKIRKA
ncbi:MAG TPA: hypothetical protein VGN20_09615 [Mucilaginibacter sp.]|jgi:hypothetical protein